MDKNTKKISSILLICIILILSFFLIYYFLGKIGIILETFEDKRLLMKKIYKDDDIQDPDEDPDDEGDDPDSDYGVDPDDLLIYKKY
jgi:hypothetical protein